MLCLGGSDLRQSQSERLRNFVLIGRIMVTPGAGERKGKGTGERKGKGTGERKGKGAATESLGHLPSTELH